MHPTRAQVVPYSPRSMIAAKPQARRVILEEAAGISGLHHRRHEAELRLRAAEQNLQRLDDVIAADTKEGDFLQHVFVASTARWASLSPARRPRALSGVLTRVPIAAVRYFSSLLNQCESKLSNGINRIY